MREKRRKRGLRGLSLVALAVALTGAAMSVGAAGAAALPAPTVGTAGQDSLYAVVDTLPEFPGGKAACTRWLRGQIRYPDDCLKAGVEGTVKVSFVVEADGAVTGAEAVSSPHPSLSAEALRVVAEMPRWKPGRRAGEAVRARFTLPVSFRLDGEVLGFADGLFADPEVAPEFPGGREAMQAWLGKHLKYPRACRSRYIEGKVFVTFVVEADGSLADVEVIKSPHEALSAEAVRVVRKMPRWKPGTLSGKPVKVRYVLPVLFRCK